MTEQDQAKGKYDELLKDLSPEGVELFHELEHVLYKKPEPVAIPEGWSELCECPPLSPEGEFFMEYLQGGSAMGWGWKQPFKEPFTHEIVARAKAWESCASQKAPTRVVRVVRKAFNRAEEYVTCLFYARGDKVYICFRLPSGRLIAQETRDPYDSTGTGEPGNPEGVPKEGRAEEVGLKLTRKESPGGKA